MVVLPPTHGRGAQRESGPIQRGRAALGLPAGEPQRPCGTDTSALSWQARSRPVTARGWFRRLGRVGCRTL